VQVEAFVFQGPPEALDEDIIDAEALAVHRDAAARPFQPVGRGKGRELTALDALLCVKRLLPVVG
jgi:hypothetical protein